MTSANTAVQNPNPITNPESIPGFDLGPAAGNALSPAQFDYHDTFGFDKPANLQNPVLIPGYAPNTHQNLFPVDDGYVFTKEFCRDFNYFLAHGAKNGDIFTCIGPKGSGKTSSITQYLARLNIPCFTQAGHDELSFQDQLGRFMLRARPGGQARMEHVFGPLVRAMELGVPYVMNEYDFCLSGEMIGFNDLVEQRRVYIEQIDRVVVAKPGFCIIFTGNTNAGGDDGDYAGAQVLASSIIDRFQWHFMDYMEPEVEKKVLGNAVPGLPDPFIENFVDLANRYRESYTGRSRSGGTSSTGGGRISQPMSTRTLIRFGQMSMAFVGAPNVLEYALQRSFFGSLKPEEVEGAAKIAQSVLGDAWDTGMAQV